MGPYIQGADILKTTSVKEVTGEQKQKDSYSKKLVPGAPSAHPLGGSGCFQGQSKTTPED